MRFFLSVVTILLFYSSAYADESPAIKPYPLTNEDRLALTRVEYYLSSISTISAEFIQAAPNGDVSTGQFLLRRPGRLRMEYNPPMPVLMVASGGDIVYYDKELDQVTHIPLHSTLVGFLARQEVKFDDTVVITGFERGDKTLRVSLVQATHPKDGTLTLELSDSPMVIRNMIVTDSSGQKTTVSLNNAHFGAALPEDLFVFKDPHPDRKHNTKE